MLGYILLSVLPVLMVIIISELYERHLKNRIKDLEAQVGRLKSLYFQCTEEFVEALEEGWRWQEKYEDLRDRVGELLKDDGVEDEDHPDDDPETLEDLVEAEIEAEAKKVLDEMERFDHMISPRKVTEYVAYRVSDD